MSYDDSSFEYDLFAETIDSEPATESSWVSSANQSDSSEFKAAFFGGFSAALETYYNATAASGDILPWGVKAVWEGEDYTETTPWFGDEAFATFNQLTDDTYDVGAGISTYLLEGMGLNADGTANKDAQVQKFAIVLDTGVAELGNGDLNVGKYASSQYTGVLNNASALGGTSAFSNKAVDASEEYYSVSQVLSASFLDYDYDGELTDEYRDCCRH